MKINHFLLTVAIVFMASSCYAEMSWTVVDAETGVPIEGAVVLVEWTITKGLPGLTHTESYEVKEVLTNKEGKVSISDVLNPFAKPHVTIYKKGYVAWNNDFIFPDYKRRTDFRWQKDYEFKLEIFKSNYTHMDHLDFISVAIQSGTASEKKGLMKSAYDWETQRAIEERRRIDEEKGRK